MAEKAEMSTMERDRHFLMLAMEEGVDAEMAGTVPIGAVLVGIDGEVLARGRNRVHSEMDATSHAEIDVIRKAGKWMIKTGDARQFTLYTTVEPCVMCSGAIYLANIKRVVWVLDDDNFGGFSELRRHPKYEGRYKNISITPRPFDDLAKIQRDHMIRWDLKRGKQNHWPEVKKSGQLSWG